MDRKMRTSREQETINRIRTLYEQIIALGTDECGCTHKLTKELMGFQKADGSFCVTAERPLDSDTRVGYYYEPTYYGAAALIHVMVIDCSKPDSAVEEALTRSLSLSMQRRLAGHGYDATRQRLDALKIFKDAGLYEWMSRLDDSSNNIFRDFCEMIQGIVSGFREAVLNGKTWSDWNVDFRESFEKEIEDYEESLVLEGGGWKGLYTLGVLDALMEYGLNFSSVAGVSAGAGVRAGVSVAAGVSTGRCTTSRRSRSMSSSRFTATAITSRKTTRNKTALILPLFINRFLLSAWRGGGPPG